jgi:type I restriction enzyme R subunit
MEHGQWHNQPVTEFGMEPNHHMAEKTTEDRLIHELETASLQGFADDIMERMVFDGEKLTYPLDPLDLGWSERVKREIARMKYLLPLLKKLAKGYEISGLKAYEQ